MKNLNAIPVFIAVVEQGSFSRAAELLGTTKSAVSKQITRLEAQLGVRLLNRSTRQMSLTQAGSQFFEHGQQALEAADRAVNAAAQQQQLAKGVLRIAMPMSFGRLHVAPLLPQFLAQYPQISVQANMSDARPDVIADGFDVAIYAGRLPDSSLIAKKFTCHRSVLCASADYLANNPAPAVPADLQQHNCVLYARHSRINEWVFISAAGTHTVSVTGNLLINNSEALRETLLQGLGIGRLPTFIAADDIQRGDLVPVLADYRMPHKDVFLLFPTRNYQPESTRVFAEFIVERLGGDNPPWDSWRTDSAAAQQ